MSKTSWKIKSAFCSVYYHLWYNTCVRHYWNNRKKVFNTGISLTKNTTLGHNIHSSDNLTVLGDGEVYIGDNTHFGHDCLLISGNHDYDSGTKLPYDYTNYVTKKINIGSNCWLGDRVVVLGGVKIGEGAVIQAGSPVTEDIPPLAVAGGHPAKVFKYRDKKHYNKLKKETQNTTKK